jgi:hypothetical protein
MSRLAGANHDDRIDIERSFGDAAPKDSGCPRSDRSAGHEKSGAGSPRLLRVQEKGSFTLRFTRPLPSRHRPYLAEIPGIVLIFYLSVNVIFAAFFWLAPGSVGHARPGSFVDVFFFSIETVATVGSGEMYPATLYGHLIASVEIACGLAFTAILTGLTFVRFSRPRAKLNFAANPVIAMHHGKPTLMVRIGNGRTAVLADAMARLNVLLSEIGVDGKVFHRAQELRLERAHLPIFPLFWTLMPVVTSGARCTATTRRERSRLTRRCS